MKGLTLEYSCSKKPDAGMIKACDEGARGMQTALVEATKVITPKTWWLMWLLTRVYIRQVKSDKIRYTFPLICSGSETQKRRLKKEQI